MAGRMPVCERVRSRRAQQVARRKEGGGKADRSGQKRTGWRSSCSFIDASLELAREHGQGKVRLTSIRATKPIVKISSPTRTEEVRYDAAKPNSWG